MEALVPYLVSRVQEATNIMWILVIAADIAVIVKHLRRIFGYD